MKRIVVKILHQARYDGFIHFIDGNSRNYCRKNIRSIPLSEAIKSIKNSNFVTDWDANLTRQEKLSVLTNRDDFLETIDKYKDLI